jgi:hypothetical protein
VLTSSETCAAGVAATSNVLFFTVNFTSKKEIHYYPNPATSQLIIDSLKISDQWETLSIASVNGNQNIIFQNISGQTKITVDIEVLSPGMYIAILRNKQGEFASFKFMKL